MRLWEAFKPPWAPNNLKLEDQFLEVSPAVLIVVTIAVIKHYDLKQARGEMG